MPTETLECPIPSHCFRLSAKCETVGELIRQLEKMPAHLPILLEGSEYAVIRVVRVNGTVMTCLIEGEDGGLDV
jgi:hypothetical protein